MKKLLPEWVYLIPDGAKKVFTGQIFDVYQWDQTLFDGTPAVFEMLKRPDTFQVIAIKDGKIVLVMDEQPGRKPNLSFPGGRAEESDDNWLNGAKRELLEETGMTFKTWKLIKVGQPAPKIEWFTPIYIAYDFESQVAQKLDAGEKIEILEEDYAKIRDKVLSGKEPRLSYMQPTFLMYETIESLLVAPELTSRELDR